MDDVSGSRTFTLIIRDGIPLLKINNPTVDLTFANELSSLLEEGGSRNRGILVDFKKVTYIDSVIISTVVKHFVTQRKNGHRLVLFNTGKLINSLLQTTRLDTVLDIAETVDEAVHLCALKLEDSEISMYSGEEH